MIIDFPKWTPEKFPSKLSSWINCAADSCVVPVIRVIRDDSPNESIRKRISLVIYGGFSNSIRRLNILIDISACYVTSEKENFIIFLLV